MNETQTAVLTNKDGSSFEEQVEAFPHNPEVIEIDGAVYVANSPVIGYGTTDLAYRRGDRLQGVAVIVGWEWALGTTVHYFRWRGKGKRGFSSVSGEDFQIAFNPIRED
jgi:hypothetical protein